MAKFSYPARQLEISRKALLLDTNVLIDAFGPEDSDAAVAARLLIHESDFQLLVPSMVLVEAWGILVRDGWERAWGMIVWVASPGSNVLVLERRGDLRAELPVQSGLHLDHVDAAIAVLATEVTRSCQFSPPLSVATRDFRDFTRVVADEGIELQLLDYTQLGWE
jgi:predicted nucleic acid-binding protein